jgi:anti-sigma B factor antagonist
MAIQKKLVNDNLELLVSGRIDGAVANELEVEILNGIRSGVSHIYVNLAEADFLCSAGMRVLLQYYRQMKNQKKVLRVCRPSGPVKATLEMTGFLDLIEP